MTIRDIISGKFLSNSEVTKRVPAIIYIIILTILYIFNSFDAQNIFRKILRVEREISQLKVKATSGQAERIKITRELNISEELIKRNINISGSNIPPKMIE